MDTNLNIIQKLWGNLKSDLLRYSVFFFLVSIGISHLLWFGYDTTFPKVPLIGDATYSDVYYSIDNLFCFVAILFVIYSVWTRGLKSSLGWAILLFFLTLFTDFKRCNALFYFYVCIWTLYWMILKKNMDWKPSYVLFVSALYFWSGVHKIHPFFHENNFIWLMNIFEITKPLIHSKIASYSMSGLEILFGILLLGNRTRKSGIILLILMHSFILIALIKAEWNTMVIPWNIFMIISLISVYDLKFSLKDFWRQIDLKLKGFLLITGVVLPFLFIFYLINPAFAYTMYAGRTVFGNVVFPLSDIPKIHSPYKDKIEEFEGDYILNITHFGPDIQNAPINYSEFIYKKLFYKISENLSDSTYLIITRYPIQSDTPEYDYIYKK